MKRQEHHTHHRGSNTIALLNHVPVGLSHERQLMTHSGHAATAHLITSSARSRNDSDIVRPSALAVLRLMTSSKLVGCSTGMSAGLFPCKTFCTNSAVCRYRAVDWWPYDIRPPASANERKFVAAARPCLSARSATCLVEKVA